MTAKQHIRIYSAALPEEDVFELSFVGEIRVGFASPVADYQGESIDLNKLVIRNRDYGRGIYGQACSDRPGKQKRNLLQLACRTGNKNWSMKQTLRSKLYTTDIRDIVKIKIR
jgi:hypothetical protein